MARGSAAGPRGSAAGQSRARGSIEPLPSGALRVSVYAGIDLLTPPAALPQGDRQGGPEGPTRGRSGLQPVAQPGRREAQPRTSATVDQLLERYLDQFAGSPNTLELYRTHVRNHISPGLGHVRIGQLDAETLDSFYGELRRCRRRCSRTREIDHRVAGPHECDDRCVRHQCRPLAPTTIRHIHFILSGAYKRAVRWRWLSVNPMAQAEPPPAPKPNPQPPTAAQAARIVIESCRRRGGRARRHPRCPRRRAAESPTPAPHSLPTLPAPVPPPTGPRPSSIRHVDDADAKPEVTAEAWLAAHRKATVEDDQHSDITPDDLVDMHADDRGFVEDVIETDAPDIREVATAEPRQTGEDAVRVPTATETSDSIERAQRSLAEIAARDVTDAYEVEQQRAEELTRWHAVDQAAVEEATTEDEAVDDYTAASEPADSR